MRFCHKLVFFFIELAEIKKDAMSENTASKAKQLNIRTQP